MKLKFGRRTLCVGEQKSKMQVQMLQLLAFAFFASRLILIFISVIFSTYPYTCYDDSQIYGQIMDVPKAQILNALTFRNCYFLVCDVLKQLHIGEYFTGLRILNVILWWIVCKKCYVLGQLLGWDENVCRKITFFMAISPYYIIYSMIPLREVICAWTVVCVLVSVIRYEKEGKINFITTGCLIVIMFFVRIGIFEIMACVYLLYKLKDRKLAPKIITITILAGIAIYLLSTPYYLYVIRDKINVYTGNNIDNVAVGGMLSRLKVTGIGSLYKLIALIPIVQISPLPSAFSNSVPDNSWGAWLSWFSGISAFMLPYFWSYVFQKKNQFEKLVLTFYFFMIAVISVASPDNARFSFFTTTLYYCFGIKEFIRAKNKNAQSVIWGIICACVPYLYLVIR